MADKKPYVPSFMKAVPGQTGRNINSAVQEQTNPFNVKKRRAETGQRQEDPRAKAIRQLKNLDRNKHTPIGTGDHASGPIMTKALNKNKPCMIVTSPTGPQRVPDSVAKSWGDEWKTRFVLDSDNPQVLLFKGNWEIRIRGGINMAHAQNPDPDPVFFYDMLKGKDMEPLEIAKQMEAIYIHAEVDTPIAKALFDMGTIEQDPKASGLVLMSFRGQGSIYARWTGNYAKRVEDKRVEAFVDDFNTNKPIMTIARKSQIVEEAVDVAFMHRCRIVVDCGLCPFLHEHIDKRLGQGFKAWYEEPAKPLPHQPWMQKIGPIDEEFPSFMHHPVRKAFGNMREWEIVTSANLIYECNFERDAIRKYFAFGITHVGQVVEKRGNFVKLAITQTINPHCAPPSVDFGRFRLRKSVPKQLEAKQNAETPAEPVIDPPLDKGKGKAVATDNDDHMFELEQYQLNLGQLIYAEKSKQNKGKGKDNTKAVETSDKSAVDEEMKDNMDPVVEQKEVVEEVDAGAESEADSDSDSDDEEDMYDDAIPGEQEIPEATVTESSSKMDVEDPAAKAPEAEGGESSSGAPFTVVVKPARVKNPGTKKNLEQAGIWNVKTIEGDLGPRDFMVGFYVSKGDGLHWQRGQIYNIELEMKINNLPAKRMLQSIGQIAGSHDNAAARSIQNFLLGEAMPEDHSRKSAWASGYDSLKPLDKKTLDDYLVQQSLNPRQNAALHGIVDSSKPVKLVQAPPGTGKTMSTATIGLTYAQLGYKTLLTAPTNNAVAALMVTVVQHVEMLYKANPALKQKMKVVFLPNAVMLRRDLLDLDPQWDARAAVTEAEIAENRRLELFRPYQLWTYLSDKMQDRSKNTELDAKQRGQAKKWLDTFNAARCGNKVSVRAANKYMREGKAVLGDILDDPAMMIVVATCNNSAQLKETEWRPDAVIIDESAFGIEHECMVPLSLFPKDLTLVGDHQQLKPNARGSQEYEPQYGMSLFERALHNQEVPMYRFIVNYRMCKDIASLPGMLGYGVLLSAPNTEILLDTYRHFRDFYYSTSAQAYRDSRRTMLRNNKVASAGMHRLFFNLNSYSATPVNSTSQVNYANALAIVETVYDVVAYEPDARLNIPALTPGKISIITGYSEQKKVIESLLRIMAEKVGWNLDVMPKVFTVDSYQGDENDAILLCLTSANPHHGSRMGFLMEWNRVNVAMTRAKQILWIFGNLDNFRRELQFVGEKHTKKFAYFIMDVLDLGQVIDRPSLNILPATAEEMGSDQSRWSRRMPIAPFAKARYDTVTERRIEQYRKDKKLQAKYELKILKALDGSRKQATILEEQYARGEDPSLDLFDREKDVENLIDEDMDPDEEGKAIAMQLSAAIHPIISNRAAKRGRGQEGCNDQQSRYIH